MDTKGEILKASYHTLGCKLNFAETAALQTLLKEKGIVTALPEDTPDICVINTCSVTAVADKKAKNLIRSLARKYPNASVIVTGCYAELKPDEVAQLPGVQLVIGNSEKINFSAHFDSWFQSREKTIATADKNLNFKFYPTCQRGDRTRFFLKVQDGCNYFCTYCTIPLARGFSRSGPIAEMVQLAEDAANKNGREIVITGVNIGEFGKDHGEDFFSLLKSLDKVNGIERFRISSIEPNLLTDDMIKWIANESRAIMPHFHIPLQSGSDKVLALMKRKYDTALFKEKIDLIRSFIPDAFIGIDIMAGAKGETEEEWQKSLEFVKSIDVTRFHVFPYSERPGTRALQLAEPVSQEEKHRRVSILNDISDRKLNDFISRNIGKEAKVLWETKTTGVHMQGLTENYLRVEAPLIPELLNNISSVRLIEADEKKREIIKATHI